MFELLVSVHNSPRAPVVTGQSKALFNHAASLPKVSKDLVDVIENLIKEDFEGKELWKAKDLQIFIGNNETGKLNSLICG